MSIDLKLLALLFVGACSTSGAFFKSPQLGSVRIIKNSQTSQLRGIRLQEIEARYALERDKTRSLEDFLMEAEKNGALYASHLRITDFGPTETCIIFVGPEEELKTELLTQLHAQDTTQKAKAQPQQIRSDYLSERYSQWKLAETKALCQPADSSRASGYTLIQARVYLSANKLNSTTE